jgi:hypothetical protein
MRSVQDRLTLPLWKLELQLEQAVRVEARLRAEHAQAKRTAEDIRTAIALRRHTQDSYLREIDYPDVRGWMVPAKEAKP